jgi:hypothetical protein
MTPLGPAADPDAKPSVYDSSSAKDVAPFDSVPGIGFDSSPAATAIVPPAGKVSGTGAALVVDPAQNNAFRAVTRAWAAGARVERVADLATGAQSAKVDGGALRYAIRGLAESAQNDLVAALALAAERRDVDGAPVARPRIGLVRPWGSSMDEGWTRWVLERYGFEPIALRPADFRAPLSSKVDVIILAEDARLPIEGSGGPGRGGAPAAAGGRGGGRAVRPEYADVLSAADLERFEQFIRDGGTVVCLGSASTFAIGQFKLPVRNVVAGLRPEEFFLRGSIVEVTADTSHPVMAGMPDKAAIFIDGGPILETLDGFAGRVLATYQDSGSPLLSGYLIGESYLHGKAAALDVQLGNGHVVLLGFRPQWRGQSFGTLRVLFNAALFR